MQVARNVDRPHHQVAHEAGLAFVQVVERRDVSSRDDEDVRRRLRVDVVKREDLIVFENLAGRDLAARNPAEEAFVAARHVLMICEPSGYAVITATRGIPARSGMIFSTTKPLDS